MRVWGKKGGGEDGRGKGVMNLLTCHYRKQMRNADLNIADESDVIYTFSLNYYDNGKYTRKKILVSFKVVKYIDSLSLEKKYLIL